MAQQIPIDDAAVLDDHSDEPWLEVTHEVANKRLLFVNVVFLGSSKSWVLVDAGIKGSTSFIKRAVEQRFGAGSKPAAVILTHAHFDHIGALTELLESWQIPVFAHRQEIQFLDGSSSYPPPDPSVGGGLMSAMSRFFPRGPVDVSERLQQLPMDGTVPFLDDWRWIHSPGHTPGHISLFRESDRVLVSGDAVITTAQESAYGALTQEPELHGPPKYFTPDWLDAERSAEKLQKLEPQFLVPGHGRALHGPLLNQQFKSLVQNFREVATPINELH